MFKTIQDNELSLSTLEYYFDNTIALKKRI